MGRSKQASKLPEIKINDTLMKPAWIEEQPTSPGNRWKRVVALKVKVKKGQRIHREFCHYQRRVRTNDRELKTVRCIVTLYYTHLSY